MKAKSYRHHYIPEFVIRGFVNSDGNVYIYDKKLDEIKKKPRHPKSIFFEENRNTAFLNERESSSIIEDEFYKKLDNDSSKLIKRLREEDITEELLNDENLGKLQFFIINLFWRIPLTDFATKDLIIRADIKSFGIDPEELRNDPIFQKLQRIGLYEHTINEFTISITPKNDYYVKMAEFDLETFVLGDYPVVFKSTPTKFTDLNYLDFFFPVSSNRLYLSTLDELGSFGRKKGYHMNAIIIEQSTRYVVSGNLKLLQESVKYYREMKKANLLYWLKKELFNK